ncbi:M23 family metallopeptidase [Streptomyces sp. 8N616]|uniref:M23 family metallopeptidase n=1 Tax=Streptomyces sp. 8N616 TaxID=3457414 RepID=UPI003FD2108D
MPARGRHRRYQPNRISQASLTVTAGGAGMALPLVAVSGADAAPAGTGDHAQRADLAAKARQLATAANGHRANGHRANGHRKELPNRTKPESYTVVSGDTLFAIARVRDVDGGWERLYEDNREVIGGNPDLIHPGQKLVIEEKGGQARKPAKTERPEKSGKKPRKAGSSPGDQRAERADSQQGSGSSAALDFIAPVADTTIGTPYRASGSGWSSGYHTGVDFPVSTGTSVRAVASGQVVSAGWGGAYGYQVVIRHNDGKYSQYAHLSALAVREGQPVNGGQRIGRSGSTGNTTGPHLHFEVRTGPDYGSDINPLAYLRSKGVSI